MAYGGMKKMLGLINENKMHLYNYLIAQFISNDKSLCCNKCK
jgi:hypothetical protein